MYLGSFFGAPPTGSAKLTDGKVVFPVPLHLSCSIKNTKLFNRHLLAFLKVGWRDQVRIQRVKGVEGPSENPRSQRGGLYL
jgi:hypothetical protein